MEGDLRAGKPATRDMMKPRKSGTGGFGYNVGKAFLAALSGGSGRSFVAEAPAQRTSRQAGCQAAQYASPCRF
jgi:hypothetical protein